MKLGLTARKTELGMGRLHFTLKVHVLHKKPTFAERVRQVRLALRFSGFGLELSPTMSA